MDVGLSTAASANLSREPFLQSICSLFPRGHYLLVTPQAGEGSHEQQSLKFFTLLIISSKIRCKTLILFYHLVIKMPSWTF